MPRPKKPAPASHGTHSHPRAPLHTRRLRNFSLGVLFFVLGVIGVFIPVMPQLVFFFLSALFFSMISPTLRRALRRFRKRHPSIDRAYAKWREKSRRKRQELIRKARKFRHDVKERVEEVTHHRT